MQWSLGGVVKPRERQAQGSRGGCAGLDCQFEEFQTLFQLSNPSGILISRGRRDSAQGVGDVRRKN